MNSESSSADERRDRFTWQPGDVVFLSDGDPSKIVTDPEPGAGQSAVFTAADDAPSQAAAVDALQARGCPAGVAAEIAATLFRSSAGDLIAATEGAGADAET